MKIKVIHHQSFPICQQQIDEIRCIDKKFEIEYIPVSPDMDEYEAADLIDELADDIVIFSDPIPPLLVALRCSVRLVAETFVFFNPHQDKSNGWEIIEII